MSTENTLEEIIDEHISLKAEQINESLWYVNPNDIKEALKTYGDQRAEEESKRCAGILDIVKEKISAYYCGQHKKLINYIEATQESLRYTNPQDVWQNHV